MARLSRSVMMASKNIDVIMDDESYFTINGNEWQGKNYGDQKGIEVSDEVKYISKEKYPKKVMVWLALSRYGISKPVFFRSGLAVSSEIYVQKCMPKLKKFIKKYHKDGNIVFWPDLASAHYARLTTAFLEKNNIPYIQKENNPPNVPQLRPIEDFWAILKRRVYKKNFRPETIEDLIRKIRLELNKVDIALCERLMSSVPKKVRRAANYGVNCLIH